MTGGIVFVNAVDRLLIVGASARAAAMSARRAGLAPWAADLFVDRDLERTCVTCHRVRQYPREFVDVAANGPAGPWLYTGALENWPDLVDRMAQIRPLWGNRGRGLRQVRSPGAVRRIYLENGFSCPAVVDRVEEIAGKWLIKPRHGAAGRGIEFLSDRSLPVSPKSYLQEFIDGEPRSAVYVATDADVQLFGVTQQLVGESWLHARPFQYCGSVGPLVLSPATQELITQLGRVIARSFGLRGLFGIDFILRGDVPWPVEINPRFTASVEVLEWASASSAMAIHAQAFATLQTPQIARRMADPGVIGKAIYYASKSVAFPDNGPWLRVLEEPLDPWLLPDFADIPSARQTFDVGQPVLSFFARGDTPSACLLKLRATAAELDGLFADRPHR